MGAWYLRENPAVAVVGGNDCALGLRWRWVFDSRARQSNALGKLAVHDGASG